MTDFYFAQFSLDIFVAYIYFFDATLFHIDALYAKHLFVFLFVACYYFFFIFFFFFYH